MRFHGVDYLLALRSSPASLSHAPALLLSARATDGLWHASFSASEIEQMSSKTGAFQPFATMERMIVRCIEASDGSEETHQIAWKHGAFDMLSIDLLTYDQLDLLKQRRSTDAPVAAAAYTPRSNARRALNKRYVILTLSSESSPEDRIHYPLPLLFQGRPPVEASAASPAAALDVTALREQLAKLTHDIQQNGQEQPAAQQTPQRRTQQRMQHSASAIDTRSYHRSRSRSRSNSPCSRSRSRSRSPPRRSSHKSSSSQKGSSRSHKDSSSSSGALIAENERLKAELESLRILSASESARQSNRERKADLPSPSSSSSRSGRLHRIQSPEDPSALSDSEGASAPGAAAPGLDDAARSLEAIAASRTIEASEAFIASLQSQLSEARAAASFEAEVAAARIASLEAENRSLRRAEHTARIALQESETLLKAATMESARLRSARADTASARSAGAAAVAAAASPVRSAGRPRSASPLLNRSQNGSSSLPVLRGGPGAAQSPSRRSPSPYLQAQRDRRNGSTGSNASSRGSSPAGSGRGTPTHSRGQSASSARSATATTGVPPLPGIRSRSSSPAMRPRPASASPSRSPYSPQQQPQQQQPRAPIDLSYRSWTVDRSGRSSPIRRFDPVAYIERRKSLQAEKEDRIRLRNEMEIARVTTPTRSLSPSPSMSSASSTATLNRSSSPARRALNLSASTPSLEFVQSPGRGALRPSSRPDGYVGSVASPARSRARGSAAVTIAAPVNTRGGRPSNGDLARVGVLGMNDPLMFSAQGGSSSAAAQSPTSSPSAAAASTSAEFRATRTRELLKAQALQRSSGSSAAPAPNGSGILGYTARLPLEPVIPSVDGLLADEEGGAAEDATPRTQAKQVTALTARLAKLQHYLEAEKAN